MSSWFTQAQLGLSSNAVLHNLQDGTGDRGILNEESIAEPAITIELPKQHVQIGEYAS